jgi:hypothetical protein
LAGKAFFLLGDLLLVKELETRIAVSYLTRESVFIAEAIV